MTELLFPPLARPTVEVVGDTRRFPVARIFCVGRNFADHAREMGAEVDREAPFYFLKDGSALVASGATIPYPPETSDFQHEIEFVVAIGAPAWKIPAERALDVVFGYAVGLDMTRRDLQFAARGKGRPWDFGKNFENAAVITPILPKAAFGAIGDRRITLAVGGVTRQDGRLGDLVWSVEELIAHLSRHYHLMPGDLLYTGTPAGVGPVAVGDRIDGSVEGLPPLELTVGPAEAA